MLLGDHEGIVPYDLLVAGRYEEFLRVVGLGRGRTAMTLPPLSPAALEARRPTPPEELVGALQDSVHREMGRGRAARTAKGKRREDG